MAEKWIPGVLNRKRQQLPFSLKKIVGRKRDTI